MSKKFYFKENFMKKFLFISFFLSSVILADSVKFNEAQENYERINPATNKILSYNSSIAEVTKSVVNISTSKTINYKSPMDDFFNDPLLKDFFGFSFGIPQNRSQKSSSLGSGVIASSDGYIITNNHVVENADEISVNLSGSDKEYKAKIIGTDPKTDIAVIKIDAKNLKPAIFADSSKILEGDIVFAIGNPFGVGETITQGIVSALNKNNIGLNQYENFIQTDASINPGNSGGALVDSRGFLIGINSAILSRSGGNNGIGFAIPSNMVKDIAYALINNGKIDRGYIGVSIADLTSEQKELYENKKGALISDTENNMPASKAGLKRGDLVIKVDDKIIENAQDLKNLIGSMQPNKKIKITYERAGKIHTTNLVLVNMDKNIKISSSKNNFIDGLELSDLNEDLRYKFRIDSGYNGVLITSVKDDSKGQNFGFKKGDLIIQIGEKDIKNLKDLKEAFKSYKDKKILIWVVRNNIHIGIVVK